MTPQSNVYVSDHHESVLRSHSWRTAANSAAYLLDSIQPDFHILDIGCGPGTITADMAALVPIGNVVGLDYEPSVLEEARALVANRGLENVTFEVGDITTGLKYPDDHFDIVHSHQVLQHLADPVAAIQEMRRVARPGGFVACREGEVHAWTFYPDSQDLHDFVKLYMQIARAHGGQPAAARQLVALARKAGFERSSIAATASAWCYSNPEERAWWSQLWIDRLLYSSLAKKALQGKHADQDQLDRLARGWQRWAADDDGCLIIPNGEILCRV